MRLKDKTLLFISLATKILGVNLKSRRLFWGEICFNSASFFSILILLGLSGDFLRSGRYSAHTINGAWSPWSPWSQCSRDCSRGIRNRKRVCSNPEPKYGGLPCLGPSLEYQECNILPCPGKFRMKLKKWKQISSSSRLYLAIFGLGFFYFSWWVWGLFWFLNQLQLKFTFIIWVDLGNILMWCQYIYYQEY